jgi:hypothetical protein
LEGNFEQARQVLAESLAIFAELDDPHGTRWVLGHMVSSWRLRACRTRRCAPPPRCSRRLGWRLTGKASACTSTLRLRIERHRKQVRDVLGADAAVRAWAEGQKMSLAEAIAYVQRVCATTPAD